MGPSLEHRTVPSAVNIEDHPFRRHIGADLDRTLVDNAARYGDEFLTSTSGWNLRHLIAFRMVDFNDIPIEYMYRGKFYPTADDPIIPMCNKCLLCPRRTFKEARLQQRKQVQPFYSIARCENVFELNTRHLLHRKPHLARFGPCRFELHMNTHCLEALDHPFCHP